MNKKENMIGLLVFSVIIIGTVSIIFNISNDLDQEVFLGYDSEPESCTIFTVERGDTVFFGNNEDYFPKHTRMQFVPASEGKYGRVYFGIAGINTYSILGGMNDQGFSADENIVPYSSLTLHSDKELCLGDLIPRLLEECATVEEAIAWIQPYDLVPLMIMQVHVADKTGDAAIFGIGTDGELNITRKTGDYLISTNFNVAHGRSECDRYDKAEEMLDAIVLDSDLTVDYGLSILEATHNSRLTIYSNLNNLKSKDIYIYSQHDFARRAVINLDDELAKGFHSYDIEALVTQQTNSASSSALVIDLISAFIIIGTIVSCILVTILKLKQDNIIRRDENE